MTILVGLLLAGAANAAGLTVSLHKEVYAGGKAILLSEIAELSGDAELIKKAQGITCGRTPSTKSAVTVKRDFVSGRLMALGIGQAQVEFKGSEEVLIYGAEPWGAKAGVKTAAKAETAPVAEVAASDKSAAAANAAAAPVPVKPEVAAGTPVPANMTLVDVTIDEIKHRVAGLLKLEVSDIQVEAESLPPALRARPVGQMQFVSCFDTGVDGGPLGQRTYAINATLNGVAQQNLTLRVKISRLVSVVVATRRLATGTLITSADVKLEKRPFMTEANLHFEDIASIDGMEPSRNPINEGDTILRSAVKAGVVVKRNETVEVTGRLAGHMVTIRGKALEEATKGQMFRIERETQGEAGKRAVKTIVTVRATGVGRAEPVN